MRYLRQIAVKEIGKEGQEKLSKAKVAIIGCGALGSMGAVELAAAGVGKLLLVDFDTIDISNLQRQFFYTTEDLGKKKTEILESHIKRANPDIEIERADKFLTKENAKVLLKDYDFVIEATDNASSKKMIDNVCRGLSKACCIGGVSGFRGQVFTSIPDGNGFETFFPEIDESGILPCELEGVLGPAAALCASLQASEAIKYIVGKGEILISKLLVFDLLSNEFNVFTTD